MSATQTRDTVANPGASAAAIRHHYDVGNDFYALWLCDRMVYSCALWEEGETYDDLDRAQTRKLDWHIEGARAANQGRLLDVGCGWGGLLRRAVDDHGVAHGVGLTLSRAQEAHLRALDHDKLEIRYESWSDHRPEAPYDAIISIGAFEHFARPEMSTRERVAGYRSYFQLCHDWLAPGGYMTLQTYAYGNARPEDYHPFISQEGVPETDIPRACEIYEGLERLFEVVLMRNDREQYAYTWRTWRKRFEKRRDEALAISDAETITHFDKVMKLNELSFEIGATDLLRFVLRRIDKPRA